MSTDMAQSAEAGPSTAVTTGRVSSRVKNKSQRALESEDTARLMARARERARLAAEGQDPGPSSSAPKKRISKRETKGKREEREVWCLCESAVGTGPMIECAGCNDWYHFDCIHLDQPTAERIHKYICPPCEESTGEKTTRLFDITTFRSPTPPPGLIPAPVPAKKTIPRKRPLNKSIIPTSTDSKTPRSVDGDNDAADGDAGSDSGSDDGSSSVGEDQTSSSGSDSDASVTSTSRARKVKKARPSKPARSAITPGQFYNKERDTPQPAPSARVPLKSRSSTSKPVAGAKKASQHAAPGGKIPTLPPARQHVLYKLTEVVRKFFGEAMKGDEAEGYAAELESGLFTGFKEVVGGKETAGQRYKGQYSMLTSSLQPHLQESTRTAILSRALTPAQVAVLSSAELASQARADEREKARRESLQQTVRQKDEFQGGVIMGRDGMERAERARVAEMGQEAEEARREAAKVQAKAREEKRRESMTDAASVQGPNQMNSPAAKEGSDSPVPVADSQIMPSPAVPSQPTVAAASASGSASVVPSPVVRRDSRVPPSPVVPSAIKPTFNLTSAWGGAGSSSTPEVIDFSTDTPESIHVDLGVDQTELDLGDFMGPGEADGDVEMAYTGEGVKEKVKELSPMEVYQQKAVVFSRGLINPNDRAAPVPHVQARALSTLPLSRPFSAEDEWRFLLPGETLEWTGRVPSAAGISFLSQMRLSPKWDVFGMGLTMPDGQGEEVEKVYQVLLEDYVSRDRYAVCLPYGPNPPPRAAKDVYAIPLRPEDKYPDFLDLLEGLSIPAVRDRPMWVLVIVIAREELPPPPPAPLPGFTSTYPPAPGFQAPSSAPPPSSSTSAAELLKAQNLEALMRSIGTLPLSSLPPVPAPTPPHPQVGYSPAGHLGAGGSTPYPSYPTPHAQAGSMPSYTSWPPPPQGGGYDQYGAQPYYPPAPQPQVYSWNAPPGPPAPGYGGGGYGQGSGQGGQRWDDQRGGRVGERGGEREKGRERERFKPEQRDQGWGSRKRGGGGGGY